MPTEKETIAQVVKSLDPDDATLWTDDGSPIVEVVQKLCNDTDLTRANINEALPSYDRKAAAFAKGGAFKPPAGAKGLFAKEEPKLSTDTIVTADILPPNPEPRRQGGVHLEDEEARQILKDRVARAEEAVIDAKRETSEAKGREVQAEQRLTRAMNDLQRKYPPISAAANIKAHLEAQGRLAMERAGLTGFSSQVDTAMSIMKRRGFARPTRPVQNVG
jgi:hypothetical protein